MGRFVTARQFAVPIEILTNFCPVNHYYRTLLTAACISLCGLLQAQTPAGFREDADRLYALLQKTPGYKAQIKGKKKKAYAGLYASLLEANPQDDFQAFQLLSQLLLPIKDNHLGFYTVGRNYLQTADYADSAAVRQYRSSSAFLAFPKIAVNADSLAAALRSKPKDSIEGIYQYGRLLTAGLFRTARPDSLVAVVLHSNIPNWVPGQLAFTLKEQASLHFQGWFAHPILKNFQLVRSEHWVNGALTRTNFYMTEPGTVWRKETEIRDYVNLGAGVPDFVFQSVAPGVIYLRLGTFSASTKNLQQSAAFYAGIKDSLQARHLVLDLRNNVGGSFKASRKYLELARRFARSGKVYVLANHQTMSNGERFILKLKGRKNVLILGTPTKGTLAYGSNYGRHTALPSGRFGFYPTDMRDWGGYKRYEDIGVLPDQALDPERDWVEQVLAMINKTS